MVKLVKEACKFRFCTESLSFFERMEKILFLPQRLRFIGILSIILLTISFLTRLVLLFYSSSQLEWTLLNVAGIFSIGFFYDVINASYFIALPAVLYLILPERFFSKAYSTFITFFIFFILTFILLFNAVAEYFFWDEFTARFNFIAVDYLVYTSEVIGNIRQSYPIEWIIAGILVLSIGITYGFNSFLKKAVKESLSTSTRVTVGLLFLLLPTAAFVGVDSRFHNFSANSYANELAANGMYELFAAYRTNELSYEQFYPHIKDEEAIRLVLKSLLGKNTASQEDPYSIEHNVSAEEPEKKLHVILISVESLSAEFLAHHGCTKKMTPFLDSLSKYSLLFTNLYATGTRTVRGLEALSLGIPPTPGQSIVRRPNNENLFSLATVFNQKGYESKYIYGGYGYFDNMNYFFSNNGYEVVDRSALRDDEIDYENIWGVADENLFSLALKEIDKSVAKNKFSFAHIMTTSNHRPYTYPEGRIDIPSHTSRIGAVRYTDFAIGKFIREARQKPWYANTLFIITADHCASSAGKTQLPVEKYKIPMLLFSPKHIQAGTETALMSQVDIPPTILALLHFKYKSNFFGHDIFTTKEVDQRAFISTYQALGYLKKDSLVILLPTKKPSIWLLDNNNQPTSKLVEKPGLYPAEKEAISWYQAASYEFKHGKLKAGK